MDKSALNRKVVNAAKWSTVTEIASKFVTPVTNMILARMLAPEAFGVVATVTMIISFAEMFTDAGFQKYLIQREFKDDNEKFKYANVAFITNLVFSLVLWIFIAIFSDSISTLVGNPGMGVVITIASVQLPLTAFSSIQMALYRRKFDFKTLFWIRMVSVFLPFVITIPLALFGLSYWALIIGTICGRVANAILLTVKSEWKPQKFYSFKILSNMFSFSMWTLVESVTTWLTIWIDIFIIGFFFTEYFLGLYRASTTMVNSFLSLITAATTPIVFSALSRLQNNNDLFNETFLKMQRMISILIFPMGVGVFLFSDLATQILLGSQWGEASKIIGLWALTRSINIVLGNYSTEAFRAKGKARLAFLSQLLHLVILLPVCIISAKFGFWTFVYARSWIRLQSVLVNILFMKYKIGLSIFKIIYNILPTAISTMIMGVLGYLIMDIFNGILWDVVSILSCIIVYFAVLSIFPNAKSDILNIRKFVLKKV